MTYPVTLDGARFSALVVGGGEVALRKTQSLLDGGVRVTAIAPEICAALSDLAVKEARLTLHQRAYRSTDIDSAALIFAATNDPAVNQQVAQEAIRRDRLVNVADDPGAGNFVTPSVHRSGELTIAVTTGRLPAAAAAIRSEVARRFDGRYDRAIRALRTLREKLLGSADRAAWKRASRELIGEDFCERVERGEVERQVASWR